MTTIKNGSASLKWLGATLLLGSGLAYYQVSQINKTLGVDILEYSLKILREDLSTDNQTFNQDNKLHFLIEEISNQFEISKRRLQIYLNRLIHTRDYEKMCKEVNQNVATPLIASYQNQRIFEYADIVQQFKERRQFNNKLALELLKIQQRNQKIKTQNKLLLENFYQLQEKLLTTHIFQLNQDSKDKINTIYDYFKQREIFMSTLKNKENKNEQVLTASKDDQNGAWIDELNYGFKIQYI